MAVCMIKVFEIYFCLKVFCRFKTIMPFYAVKVGRIPGVYCTWVECKKNVDGFGGAVYRKFNTREEAAAFAYGEQKDGENVGVIKSASDVTLKTELKQLNVPLKFCTCTCTCGAFPGTSLSVIRKFQDTVIDQPSKRSYDEVEVTKPKKVKRTETFSPQTSNEEFTVVYTDGACTSNGFRGAKGGIGVYWGPNHPLNISEPLLGRQTNNRAEIMAAVRALNQCKGLGIRNVKLHTDSSFLIQGITQWIHKWKRNGWKLSTGGDVINKEDFELLDQAQTGLNVQWVHVRGHRGDPGNEAADQLARNGAVE